MLGLAILGVGIGEQGSREDANELQDLRTVDRMVDGRILSVLHEEEVGDGNHKVLTLPQSSKSWAALHLWKAREVGDDGCIPGHSDNPGQLGVDPPLLWTPAGLVVGDDSSNNLVAVRQLSRNKPLSSPPLLEMRHNEGIGDEEQMQILSPLVVERHLSLLRSEGEEGVGDGHLEVFPLWLRELRQSIFLRSLWKAEGVGDGIWKMQAVQANNHALADYLPILRGQEVGDGQQSDNGSGGVGIHGFSFGGPSAMGLLLAHHQALAAEATDRGATDLGVAVAAEGGQDVAGGGGVADGDQQGQVGEAVDGSQGELSAQTARSSHYFCGQWNYGDTYYCGTMASGKVVYPGAVACESWRMGQELIMGGVRGRCEDTGSWPIEAGEVKDWWCYDAEHWGWPGTPEYDQECPTFAPFEEVIWLP